MPRTGRNQREFESWLERLRKDAGHGDSTRGDGSRPPTMPPSAESDGANYYGLPLLKPPVWKWMIGAYFFVGGLGGMSALVAGAAMVREDWALVRTAMWIAAACSILSPILLVWDLGRPKLFLNMLRVLKLQSPMSVGSWIVSAFGAASVAGAVLHEWAWQVAGSGGDAGIVHGLAILATAGAALAGAFMGTYTGALLAVTAIPAWHLHRVLLPFHFGMAALGSAAGALELLGHLDRSLEALGYAAAVSETLVLVWLEVRRHGAADVALREGRAGWTLRAGGALAGPAALVLRAFGFAPAAALAFLAGALASRFGWLWAGRASAEDPSAVLASQLPRTRAW